MLVQTVNTNVTPEQAQAMFAARKQQMARAIHAKQKNDYEVGVKRLQERLNSMESRLSSIEMRLHLIERTKCYNEITAEAVDPELIVVGEEGSLDNDNTGGRRGPKSKRK